MSMNPYQDGNGNDVADHVVSFTTITWDEAGRIVGRGTRSRAELQAALAAGERVMVADPGESVLGGCRFYVAQDGPFLAMLERPALAPVADTLTPAPGVEVAITGLPACRVTFTGPVAGAQDHDGRDALRIGWSVPGRYSLTIEAWPHLPATLDVDVVAA